MFTPPQIALMFDLDNTLIDSHIDFLAVRHRLIDLLQSRGAADRPREELVRLALPQLIELGARADAGLATQMWEEISDAERTGLRRATVMAHAVDVLRSLRVRGFRLALLTNNARQGVAERLTALHLEEFFEVVATRDEVSSLKPSPDGIHYVLARLGGIQRAYLVGDAWIDGRAAEAAGVRFIGFGAKEEDVRARGIAVWAWISNLRGLLEQDLEG